jgi:hypothetical protein
MIDPVALKGTLEFIEAHPEQWNQEMWGVANCANCTTSYCFAGWACVLAGDDDFRWEKAWGENEGRETVRELADGESVKTAAARILGLDWEQASRLFDEHNTLPELRRIVKELIEDA